MSDRIKLVKPSLPGGFKDYSPQQMLARRRILTTIEGVLRCFGFVPLQTSIGQRRVVLTGRKPPDNIMWNLTADRSQPTNDEEFQATARYDLTVPLARYVAEHINEIYFPLRRSEWGPVFRGEASQAGRFNEFGQFDADIVGAPVGPADAEIISLMYEVMHAIGIERFLVRVSNRKILDGFAERVGCRKGLPEAGVLLRTFDKIEKIGLEGVLAQLAARGTLEEGEGLAFDDRRLALVREFMALCEDAKDNDERLARLEAYFHGEGIGADGVAELQLITPLVRAAGVPETHWIVDPSIVRGLGYYTGTVFETFLLDKPKFGSVYSGGRYDHLVARFTGDSLPAVGTSVGVDRLFAALELLNALEAVEPDVEVFVIDMDSSLRPDYFRMATELRRAGVRVEIGMPHQNRSTKAQMATALARRAPIILFYGPDDAAKGSVALKNTQTRQQTSVPRAELVQTVLQILSR